MLDGQRRVARAIRLLVRGLCLRCPRCGARSLFRTWFSMYERCSVCQLRFEREQGYFLGAMYINYGVTVVLALIGSFALEWWTKVSLAQAIAAVDRVLQPFSRAVLSPLAWSMAGARSHF